MFRSLYSKLAAVILILFALAGVLVMSVLFVSVDLYRQEVSQKLNRDLAKNILQENLLVVNKQIQTEALEHVFHMMMVINPSIELYLLDNEGYILAFSAAPGKVKRERIDLTPLKTWLAGRYTLPLLGEDPRHPVRGKVFSAAAIRTEGTLEGYLYVILGGEDYDTIAKKVKNSFTLSLSGWVIFAGFILTGLTGLLIFFLLTRRLNRLAVGIRAFKSGQEIKTIELSTDKGSGVRGDEIEQLSGTFQEMATRIEMQFQEIQKTDNMRRELVANVSHDLRTPLATMTAYLETLQQKADSVTTEELQKYVQVTRAHCDRLNSLVNDLFELSRLEAEEIGLELEPFSLAELVQDVLLNFEMAAHKKGISFTTNIREQQPFVVGDIRLVERVLENLISNAIRHTPYGCSVSVLLSSSIHSLRVQVLDTGMGIGAADLPHIFDRFSRPVDSSNNDASATFSGLGLAIAKKIMDLHGSNIEVMSEPDSGTCFSFKLPLHSIG